MLISQRSLVALATITCAFIACAQTASRAQQPVPLRLNAPAPHVVQVEPPAPPAQTQTSRGELLDVDAKASTLTIKTQSGEMTFRYNETTKVTGAQKGVAGLATMTGSQVTVQFKKEGSLNIATTIDVREQK